MTHINKTSFSLLRLIFSKTFGLSSLYFLQGIIAGWKLIRIGLNFLSHWLCFCLSTNNVMKLKIWSKKANCCSSVLSILYYPLVRILQHLVSRHVFEIWSLVSRLQTEHITSHNLNQENLCNAVFCFQKNIIQINRKKLLKTQF